MENCLLCEANKANQKNSHIIPAFLTNRILTNDERSVISFSSKPENIDILYVHGQDTSKEDNLLCSDCESFFGKLETEFSKKIHFQLREDIENNLYYRTKSTANLTWRDYFGINKTLSVLFIYSIIFRCHISRYQEFSDFKLTDFNLNRIKAELLKYRVSSTKKIIEITKNLPLSLNAGFQVFIPRNFERDFCNLVAWLPIENKPSDYSFILGEYRLYVSFDEQMESEFSNHLRNSTFSIIILENKEWNDLFSRDGKIFSDAIVRQKKSLEIPLRSVKRNTM